ncbi:hypothetical protein D3C73_582640 [compost metagenome]
MASPICDWIEHFVNRIALSGFTEINDVNLIDALKSLLPFLIYFINVIYQRI